jgi:hypothetical protein
LKFDVETAVLGQGIVIVTKVSGWTRAPAKGVILRTFVAGKLGAALMDWPAIVTS